MTDNPEIDEAIERTNGSTQPRSSVGFWVVLGLMIAAAGIAIWQRNLIRAQWWAMRLADATSPEDQAYYVACLTAIGDEATWATGSLIKNQRPEVRTLGLAILGHLPGDRASALVSVLLDDADRDVRENAGLTLAFNGKRLSLELLEDAARNGGPDRACAALAGLARVADAKATRIICDVLTLRTRDADALIRAQAAESLAELLTPSGPAGATPGIEQGSPCDPVKALVKALADRGTFGDELATERQIAGAIARARTYTTMPVLQTTRPANTRMVAEVAAAGLSKLTGRAVVPGGAMETEQVDELARQYRDWIAERAKR